MPEKVLQATKAWFRKNVRPLWENHLKPLAPFKCYLEIGVFEGESLLWAAENLLCSSGLAYGVDPWVPEGMGRQQSRRINDAMRISRSRVKEFNETDKLHRIVSLYQEKSEGFLKKVLIYPDIIYVDGNHRAPFAITDIVLSWSILRKGGILIVDDIHLRKGSRPFRLLPETGEAWDAFSACYENLFEVVYKEEMQVAVRKL